MRLKIVVENSYPSWVTRTRSEWRELTILLRAAWRRVKQFLCGLRGHDYVLKAQRRRLSLHCPACGHTSPGWDLSDPTPPVTSSDRPRYLELLRKRS